MAGPVIIGGLFTHMSVASVGKAWRVELSTELLIGGFPTWLLQVACLGAKHRSLGTIEFLTQKLKAPSMTIPRNEVIAASSFITQPWKPYSLTSTVFYWSKQSQAHSDSRRSELELNF